MFTVQIHCARLPKDICNLVTAEVLLTFKLLIAYLFLTPHKTVWFLRIVLGHTLDCLDYTFSLFHLHLSCEDA